MDLGFHPVPKPNHKRKTPKRGDKGKFSSKTIKEILERDGYRCIRCGSYHIESTPHHVIYRSAGGEGTKRNGVSCCRECHTLAHSKKEVRKWFEKYVEENFNEKGDFKHGAS